MRLLILAPTNNVHTYRWVCALASYPVEICLFGLEPNERKEYAEYSNVRVVSYNRKAKISNRFKAFDKLSYLGAVPLLKRTIAEFKPDILHAHYASSYGLLGAMAKFHPYIISVWGSDIYDFPCQSFLHKALLKFNLGRADKLLSTSHVMAIEAAKYTPKDLVVTPFGVDTTKFNIMEGVQKEDDCFVIGNVKTLSEKYGIDVLIESFALVVANNPDLKLRLDIIGKGPDEVKLKALAVGLGIAEKVRFLGYVDNAELPRYYNSFSIASTLSVWNSESFGVVAVEAMACGCPVVNSDADGFREVVEDGKTGFIVPKHDAMAAAAAIQKFIDNPSLIEEFGANGRARVLELYNWSDNVELMYDVYTKLLAQK